MKEFLCLLCYLLFSRAPQFFLICPYLRPRRHVFARRPLRRGEQATELVHIGLVAMMSDCGAELFNRTCFNYSTLGDLYK
jgi:hypothetical protein